MEIKKNESTNLRPDGERVLNAPLVNIDLNVFLKTIKSESAWKEKDRNAMTVYKNESMRILLIALHKDAVLARHTADGVISVQVLDGKIKFTTDHDEAILEQGQMITLQRGLAHSVAALKEAVFLLTMATGK